MTRSVDPPRLLELADTPPNLFKLLQDARGDGPSAAEIEQLIHVAGTLAEPLQSGLFLADQIMPQAAASSGVLGGVFTGAGKIIATVVVALSTSALGVAGWSLSHGGALPYSTSRPNVSGRQLAPSEQPNAVRNEGNDASSSKAESPAPPAGRGLTPQVRETSTQARRAAARHATTPPKLPIAAMPDPEEFRVLQAAREELPSSPERALVLAESHARRFSRGMLDQERETIAIEALARLGRADEAITRSRVFLSRFPASPYRSRVETAISSLAK